MVRAAWNLADHPELDRLRLRQWAHQLGFGGHWSTKSRRYSTTFTALRRARVEHNRRRGGQPLDAWGRPEDEGATVVLARWAYVGHGYRTTAEATLALHTAMQARGHQTAA